jgi:preprotein translocase subunit SecY
MGLYNMFTGGALLKGAVCALGIMPYISASIIFQLMTAVVPALSRLQQEGDVGRQKLTQYTRYATVVICFIQACSSFSRSRIPARLFPGYDIGTYGNIVLVSKTWFLVQSTIFLTAGTMLMMWLGEQITQRGIGNGVSLLITVGILADIPGAAAAAYQLFFAPIGTASLGLPQRRPHARPSSSSSRWGSSPSRRAAEDSRSNTPSASSARRSTAARARSCLSR